jgi:tripartite-type tricarboxylate transporter receptor subunit TctC
MPDLVVGSLFGFTAPPGTPPVPQTDPVQALHKALAKPTPSRCFGKLALLPASRDAASGSGHVNAATARQAEVIRQNNIRVEE